MNEGSLDLDATHSMTTRMLEGGVTGLIPLGTRDDNSSRPDEQGRVFARASRP
ncbi:hypothetical protein [Pelagerythrobacter aerophilus]